jgi:hypothetical protein
MRVWYSYNNNYNHKAQQQPMHIKKINNNNNNNIHNNQKKFKVKKKKKKKIRQSFPLAGCFIYEANYSKSCLYRQIPIPPLPLCWAQSVQITIFFCFTRLLTTQQSIAIIGNSA